MPVHPNTVEDDRSIKVFKVFKVTPDQGFSREIIPVIYDIFFDGKERSRKERLQIEHLSLAPNVGKRSYTGVFAHKILKCIMKCLTQFLWKKQSKDVCILST